MSAANSGQFDIAQAICVIGKITNNIELHGDESVSMFGIPVSSMLVPTETINALWGDPHFDRCLFNHGKAGIVEPMPWTRNSVIRLEEVFEAGSAEIKFKNDEVHKFENCRMKGFIGGPLVGGMTELSFQLQLNPGLDRANLLLQEYQNEEIKLSIMSAAISKKKNPKQKEMQLTPQPDAPKADPQPVGEQIDATRVIDTASEELKQDTERQLGEALRGLEKDKAA